MGDHDRTEREVVTAQLNKLIEDSDGKTRLDALKLKIELLGLMSTAVVIPGTSAPTDVRLYDPASVAALKNPAIRKRIFSVERAIARELAREGQ